MHSLSAALVLVFLFLTCNFVRSVPLSQDNGETTVVKHNSWQSRKVLRYVNDTSVDAECSEVVNVNYSSQCTFVKTTPDCQLSDGFIHYLYLPYCLLPHGAALFILFLWIMFLFVVLAVTADDYFCPCLVIISRMLKLSQNAAGVTFLALGNGSPDIISAIIAILHSDSDPSSADLGIESLLGSGIFISAFVLGVIAIISKNFTVTRRPFVRDITFCLGSIGWVIIALYRKEITRWESIGMIILCIIYIAIVIGGLYIYQYWKKNRNKRIVNAENFDSVSLNCSMESQLLPYSVGATSSNHLDENSPLVHNGTPTVTVCESITERPAKKLCNDIFPLMTPDWQQAGLLVRALIVIKVPVKFVLTFTTPVVDYSQPDSGWNKWLNVIHCVTGPMFIVMATRVGKVNIGGCFPIWALTLCIGIVTGLIVALVTTSNQIPKYQWVFSFLAFGVSVVWLYFIANEIVALLELFGISFKLSGAILGLTFLAWGTSLGELVTSAVLAKKGLPNMGASACFGGAMLNLLLGIGISYFMFTVKLGHSVKLPREGSQYIISAAFLITSLASSGIMIPLMGFKVPRLYGIYLIVLYIAYLIVSCVIEVKSI